MIAFPIQNQKQCLCDMDAHVQLPPLNSSKLKALKSPRVVWQSCFILLINVKEVPDDKFPKAGTMAFLNSPKGQIEGFASSMEKR